VLINPSNVLLTMRWDALSRRVSLRCPIVSMDRLAAFLEGYTAHGPGVYSGLCAEAPGLKKISMPGHLLVLREGRLKITRPDGVRRSRLRNKRGMSGFLFVTEGWACPRRWHRRAQTVCNIVKTNSGFPVDIEAN